MSFCQADEEWYIMSLKGDKNKDDKISEEEWNDFHDFDDDPFYTWILGSPPLC